MYYFLDLNVLTSFVAVRGSGKHAIDIRIAYETLGADKSAALLDFHACTGCDQTSKFCGKSKFICWKVFTAANENIINPYQRIGDNGDDTLDSIRDGLVQFVVKLYFMQNSS